MYRRSRFLIGFLAAALTFGGLMATMGPEHFHRALHWHHRMGSCCMYNDERMDGCDDRMGGPYDGHDRYDRHYRYEQDEPVAPPRHEMEKDSIK